MTPAWRARHHVASAQRIFFAAGALALAAASAWWGALPFGGPRPPGMPATVLHALSMTFGFFPMFFAGFVFSTGSKWLKVPPPGPRPALAVAGLHLAGWFVVVAPGVGQGTRGAGLAAVAVAGWASVGLIVAGLRASAQRDTLHLRLFAVAAAIGATLAGAAALGVALERWSDVLAACRAGVWTFVGLTFLSAAHRMVAFVSGTPFAALDARLPRLVLWTIGTGLAAAAAAELGWLPAAVAGGVRGVGGLALAVFAARWPFAQRLRAPLLRMLHAGFCWLAASFVLAGVGVFVPTGSVPLHAFTVGFLGSTMLAMLSRTIAGQAGVAESVDRALWRLFLVLQAAAALRVAGPLVPWPWATAVAGVAWGAVWLAWSARHLRLLGVQRPRGR